MIAGAQEPALVGRIIREIAAPFRDVKAIRKDGGEAIKSSFDSAFAEQPERSGPCRLPWLLPKEPPTEEPLPYVVRDNAESPARAAPDRYRSLGR